MRGTRGAWTLPTPLSAAVRHAATAQHVRRRDL